MTQKVDKRTTMCFHQCGQGLDFVRFLKKILCFNYVFVCLSVCMCTQVQVSMEAKGGCRIPGAGITCGCEPSDTGTWIVIKSSERIVHGPNN